MNQHYWYIRNCSLFQMASVEDFEVLERNARQRKFAKGETIYLPHDIDEQAFLLAKGRIQIGTSTSDGKQATIAFIEPGELFGELALLHKGPREERAEATIESVVIAIPKPTLVSLMERSPHLCLGVTKMIGLRRQRIERRLRSLLFHNNREKLVHLLLELAQQYGQPSATGVKLSIRLTHQDLASIIGITRESVTILLGELRAAGILIRDGQRIEIVNMERLAGTLDSKSPTSTSVGALMSKASLRTDSQLHSIAVARSTI